jgi:hypothetical protein
MIDDSRMLEGAMECGWFATYITRENKIKKKQLLGFLSHMNMNMSMNHTTLHLPSILLAVL